MTLEQPLQFNLDLFNQRDAAQLKLVFWEFYSTLVDIAQKRVLNADVAKDIVLKIFFRIRSNLDKTYESFEELKATLLTAVENGSIDHFRKKSTSKERYFDSYPLEPSISSSEELVARRAILTQVYREIDKLSAKRKEVIKLRYIDGLDIREIAEVTGTKVSTVKDHLQKGLAHLRKVFLSDAGGISLLLYILSVILFFILNKLL